VDVLRLGATCRALRIKKLWRQVDLATRAGVSEAAVSRLERGRVGDLHVAQMFRVAEALGARVDLVLRYQGGDLDRLLNSRHSALHEAVARAFKRYADWEIAPEVSCAIWGERGVIDILAWHAPTRTLLVIELKTEIVDINELMGVTDRKRRLASQIAVDRGWEAATAAMWVIVADSKTNRRRVAEHATTLRAAYPFDGRHIRPWLRAPKGAIGCLSFWPNPSPTEAKSGMATVKRVRRPIRTAY
jgi:transcriptional regulator with XRE-family HTH domain